MSTRSHDEIMAAFDRAYWPAWRRWLWNRRRARLRHRHDWVLLCRTSYSGPFASTDPRAVLDAISIQCRTCGWATQGAVPRVTTDEQLAEQLAA